MRKTLRLCDFCGKEEGLDPGEKCFLYAYVATSVTSYMDGYLDLCYVCYTTQTLESVAEKIEKNKEVSRKILFNITEGED